MNQAFDILTLAHKQPFLHEEMEVLQEQVRTVPGSVQYSIKRYRKQPQWNMDDTGMLIYHYEKNNASQNYLELKFCVSGNVYCRQKQTECDYCKFNASRNCIEKVDSVDVLSLAFPPLIYSNLERHIKHLYHFLITYFHLRTIHLFQKYFLCVARQGWQ